MVDFKAYLLDYIVNADVSFLEKIKLYNNAIKLRNETSFIYSKADIITPIYEDLDSVSKRMNREELLELVTKLVNDKKTAPYACISDANNKVRTLSKDETLEIIRNSVDNMLEYYLVGDETLNILKRLELVKITIKEFEEGKFEPADAIRRIKLLIP